MKAVLKGKFIALSAFIKNLERAHTSDLTAHMKALEEKEAWKQKEIIKLRAKINKIETGNLSEVCK